MCAASGLAVHVLVGSGMISSMTSPRSSLAHVSVQAPAAAPVPAEVVKVLRLALEHREAELQELLSNREDIAINASAEMLDQIQNASERDLAIANLERDSARLMEVRAALQRMTLGTFGICMECDEPIHVKRLTALPWTMLCLACQEAAEQTKADAFGALAVEAA